jgi:NAD-dependent DNA ligase
METVMSNQQLTNIPGVGAATARALVDAGFSTVEAIAKASEDKLAAVPGFGPSRAAVAIAAARDLVASEGVQKAGGVEPSSGSGEGRNEKDDKKKKKSGKKDKKDKKDKKKGGKKRHKK